MVIAQKDDKKPVEKETPLDKIATADAEKKRKPGNWIKATIEQVAVHEAAKTLVGYDPAKGEVLLKEGSK